MFQIVLKKAIDDAIKLSLLVFQKTIVILDKLDEIASKIKSEKLNDTLKISVKALLEMKPVLENIKELIKQKLDKNILFRTYIK